MNKMMTALLATAAVAALPSAAQAQNLVTNGGFETGTFANWTVGNPNQYVTVQGGAYAFQGSSGASMGTIGSVSTLTQSVATTAAQTYNISFALANFSGSTPNSFGVTFGGVALAPTLVNSAAFGYTVFNYSAVASGAASALQFSFRHDPSFWGLDAVSVTRAVAGVPEPSSWGLMILGFGAVGGAMRRRSVKVAYAA